MPSGVIPPPSIGSGTGRKPLGQAVYRMSSISMQDDGMGRAQTDRQGARIRPLFAKDAITSLEQHGADLAPRIGRSSVEEDIPVGVGGIIHLGREVGDELLEGRQALSRPCERRGGSVKGNENAGGSGSEPYCKAVDSWIA